MAGPITAEAPVADESKLGGPYAWFVVFVLCLAAIVGYVDRQVINLLVDPIKAVLGINDTQIGLLQGFSFVIIYALVAIRFAGVTSTRKLGVEPARESRSDRPAPSTSPHKPACRFHPAQARSKS